MTISLKEIGDNKHTVWITQPREINTQLLERREKAYQIAMGKLAETQKIETVMQTAEAFGRGLHAEFLQKQEQFLSVDEWITEVVNHIFNPMGTAATFTHITDDQAKAAIFKCPVADDIHATCNHCPFSYGFVRGLFKSAFPTGEILMGKVIADGAPMCEFTFKRFPTEDDLRERERIKNKFRHPPGRHGPEKP